MMVSSILFLSESGHSYRQILGHFAPPGVVSGRAAGPQVYLDAFGAVLPVYALGETEAPQ